MFQGDCKELFIMWTDCRKAKASSDIRTHLIGPFASPCRLLRQLQRHFQIHLHIRHRTMGSSQHRFKCDDESSWLFFQGKVLSSKWDTMEVFWIGFNVIMIIREIYEFHWIYRRFHLDYKVKLLLEKQISTWVHVPQQSPRVSWCPQYFLNSPVMLKEKTGAVRGVYKLKLARRQTYLTCRDSTCSSQRSSKYLPDRIINLKWLNSTILKKSVNL